MYRELGNMLRDGNICGELGNSGSRDAFGDLGWKWVVSGDESKNLWFTLI